MDEKGFLLMELLWNRVVFWVWVGFLSCVVLGLGHCIVGGCVLVGVVVILVFVVTILFLCWWPYYVYLYVIVFLVIVFSTKWFWVICLVAILFLFVVLVDFGFDVRKVEMGWIFRGVVFVVLIVVIGCWRKHFYFVWVLGFLLGFSFLFDVV